MTYLPYGGAQTLVPAITNNVRFPGQYQDLGTYFYYNINRDYFPGLGRYIEADPIGLAGGMNPYLYAKGNPTTFIDPLGLFVGPLTQVAKAVQVTTNVVGAGGGPENPYADIAGAVAGLVTLTLSGDTPDPNGQGGSSDRTCHPLYVVRGGEAKAIDLEKGTFWSPNGYGFSVQSAPEVDVDELARGGFFKNPSISYTTALDLMAIGLQLKLDTPGKGLYHSTVVVPFPPPPGVFTATSGIFTRKTNPFRVPSN